MAFESRKDKISISQNLDLSIISVLDTDTFMVTNFKKISLSCQKNGLEIIIVHHFDITALLIKEIEKYPFTNYLLIEVDNIANSLIFNVAASNSTKKNLLFCNIFTLEIDFYAIEKALYIIENYANSFVKFKEYSSLEENKYVLLNEECILLSREDFVKVRGFINKIENKIEYLSRILEKKGKKRICQTKPALIFNQRKDTKYSETDRITLYPKYNIGQENKINWQLIFHWKIKNSSYSLCNEYLKKYKKFKISDGKVFKKRYPILLMVQTYNESKYIKEALQHFDNYCDGIIMLDDESQDGTYELADSEKLILKVQKERTEFNDLQNRNMLLEIASFFNSDWLIFLDADERFDKRYDNIYKIINETDADVISFNLVNLWNTPQQYKVDMKDNTIVQEGILTRPRLFKNIGYSQIILNFARRLHFSPVPYLYKLKVEKLLLLHFGTLTESQRKKKYNFYLKEDDMLGVLNYNYDYLLEDTPKLKDVNEILL